MNQKKKISLLLIVVIGAIALFVACGSESMKLNPNGKVLSANFLEPINKINKANIYYSKEDEFLGIELNYDGPNANDIINKFKKDVNDIMNQESNQFKKYSEIKEIHFILLYKNYTNNNSIDYKLEGDKFVKSDERTDLETLSDYTKFYIGTVSDNPHKSNDNSTNNNINDNNINSDNSINNDKDNYIYVPDNGEFTVDNEHLNNLSFENNKLEYSNFKVDDDVIKIELLYNNQLTKGVLMQIQKNIKNMFGDKEIELNISQKHPMNRFEFEYKDNTWKEE